MALLNGGHTPMFIADHPNVAQWLLLQGAANGDDGHVDRTLLLSEVPQYHRAGHRASLLDLIITHATFVSTVITAITGFRVSPEHRHEKTRAAKRLAAAARRCVMASLLGGHEKTLLALIADFVGW